MTEKHNWVTDDLCLIEETTGVKLYGTVCTDISFIANQLNMANKTIRELEKENKELKEENEQLKSFKSRVFNLLQDEIREESELLDYYLKEKAPYNADRQQIIIGVLKRLQKELKE